MTPLPTTERRASLEPPDAPSKLDSNDQRLQIRNEIVRTTRLLRLGLEQLEPLLELRQTWKEVYTSFQLLEAEVDNTDLPLSSSNQTGSITTPPPYCLVPQSSPLPLKPRARPSVKSGIRPFIPKTPIMGGKVTSQGIARGKPRSARRSYRFSGGKALGTQSPTVTKRPLIEPYLEPQRSEAK